ncbi:MAG TPA: sn-glycerol-3-phosphate ABC transporter ATP-binding protein UgpC [Gaiellaceae bacterium]
MAGIALERLTKVFPDGTEAVSSVDLDIPDGALAVVVGPSGCGKTTVLRMVAGLEEASTGTIRIGDRVVNDLSPRDRDIAMVFQNYALYPQLSVFDNMAFGLKLRRADKREISRRVHEAARILDLEELLDRKPARLSGGQRQRVAMGRAIVREPQAFLMDEPLSNLDAKLRVQMRAEISRLQRQLGVTTMYVTHDQTEAMTMGDLVAVLRKGVLQAFDTPERLYNHPANLFVAGFIGSPAMNLLQTKLERLDGTLVARPGRERLQLDGAVRARPGLAQYEGRSVALGIRSESLEDAALVGGEASRGRLSGVVELREDMGSDVFAHVRVEAASVLTEETRDAIDEVGAQHAGNGTTTVVARLSPRTRAREGDAIELAVDGDALHFFDLETGEGIYG